MQLKQFYKMSKMPGCILDKNGSFVFFCHNKVAQTSINRSLLKGRAVVKKDNKALFFYYQAKTFPIFFINKPFCFTIVRNPYDRAVSAFNYLKKIGKISEKDNFSEFIKFKNSKIIDFDPHFRPQFHWDIPLESIGFEFIGRFENLNHDWNLIANKINAPTVLPHSNKGGGERLARLL